MYRSNLDITIDGEVETDTSSTDLDFIGITEDEYPSKKIINMSLKVGISAFSMLALVNTVQMEGLPKRDFYSSSVVKHSIGHMADEELYIDQPTNNDCLSVEQFNNAMTELKNIWESCPDDAPTDLSTNHNSYLYKS